eukprot:3518012-Prymnesium_polylepis.1
MYEVVAQRLHVDHEHHFWYIHRKHVVASDDRPRPLPNGSDLSTAFAGHGRRHGLVRTDAGVLTARSRRTSLLALAPVEDPAVCPPYPSFCCSRWSPANPIPRWLGLQVHQGRAGDVLRAQRERRTDTALLEHSVQQRKNLRSCAAAGRAAVRRAVLCVRGVRSGHYVEALRRVAARRS